MKFFTAKGFIFITVAVMEILSNTLNVFTNVSNYIQA